MSDVHQRIDDIVKNHRVVLFMKGTPQFPMCGFSGRAIQILKACGVGDLKTVNVLEDEEIRQGIKSYSDWPTIPQLYVNGEFVGGSDIMTEMYQAGELQQTLGVADLKTVNVLEDEEIRQGIKAYSDWPTIPQLYVNGEFVGGSDILTEMYQAGELQQTLGIAA